MIYPSKHTFFTVLAANYLTIKFPDGFCKENGTRKECITSAEDYNREVSEITTFIKTLTIDGNIFQFSDKNEF